MLGDGIVSFGTAVATFSRRKVKSSAKIVCSSRTGAPTRIEAGVKLTSPLAFLNSTTRSDASFSTPPSW